MHLLPDLHTEIGPLGPPPAARADVKVPAGDTATTGRLHPWPNSASASGRPADGGFVELKEVAAARGAVFLENECAVVGGVRFVFP